MLVLKKMLLILLFLPVSKSCKFLNNVKSVGVTPDDVIENYPLIIYNKIAFKSDAYLIIHTNLNETLSKIKLHKSNQFWKRDSLVCVKSKKVDIEIFKSLWSLQVANVVLETPLGNFVFNPFNNTIMALHKNTFFKIWTNLYGYEIPISVFQHNLSYYKISIGYGIDGCFLYELSKWMNFTPVIVQGTNHSNTIRQLKQNKAEMGGVAQFFKYYGRDIQLTSVLYNDELCYAMRRAGIFRGWDIFMTAFQWQVWAIIIATALVTNSILTVMCPRLNWTGWLPITLRAMSMVASDQPPKTFKERLIIGGCLLFGVVIVTSFQAILYNFIHTRTHYKNPQKVSEITIPKMKLSHVTDELLNKYAVKIRRKEINFAIQSGRIDTQTHIVPECVSSYNLGYPLKYGSPYYKYVKHFTQVIFESGIHNAWYRKTIFIQKLPKAFKIFESVRVLNLSDFEVAFFTLIAGLLVSLIVFILEIISKSASNHIIFKSHLDPFTPYTD